MPVELNDIKSKYICAPLKEAHIYIENKEYPVYALFSLTENGKYERQRYLGMIGESTAPGVWRYSFNELFWIEDISSLESLSKLIEQTINSQYLYSDCYLPDEFWEDRENVNTRRAERAIDWILKHKYGLRLRKKENAGKSEHYYLISCDTSLGISFPIGIYDKDNHHISVNLDISRHCFGFDRVYGEFIDSETDFKPDYFSYTDNEIEQHRGAYKNIAFYEYCMALQSEIENMLHSVVEQLNKRLSIIDTGAEKLIFKY